ncbi:ComEC/Rec2 family competence protein [Alkalihalobacillus sp. AL-G]|uniref:ComEC/Rec2 family competence protein n=1 Tax=Alkalihalobacillus sp. AL-G TaxID=2926399 RepID=UPI00272AD918|nr:hypothetical protein [Alkalihalobacillus sp. AL-G]WLD91795.1 hypothetical protein MOJ78_12175 [Alkalihalobacillus sp. AL-G]
MYRKPVVLFVLFLFMITISRFPDEIAPDLFMVEKTGGNVIKDLDLNLKSGEVVFSFLELSSGESTLIQNHKGQNILINTGSLSSKRQFRQQLSIFGVEKIDALIFTNVGKLYTGNLPWLLKHMKVKQIYLAEQSRDQFVQQFSVNDEQVLPLKQNDTFTVFNGLKIDVAYIEDRKEFHEGGLALVLKYKKHQFLYMGVASKEADEAVISQGIGDTELLKVGGFGHYFGTSEHLLNHIDSEIAVIFKKEGYNVSDDVSRRLQEHWTEILLPFKQGIVMVKCNDSEYKITTVPLIAPDLALQS